MKIFIGNIGDEVRSDDLSLLFAAYGKVLWACVPIDSNNTSRGYGYVRMQTPLAARNAITALNKKRFMQQYISVSEALCQQDIPAA